MMGIFALSKPIEGAIHDRTGNRLRPSPSASTPVALGLLKRLACGVIMLLSAGLGAWLGSAGILLYHFYSLTPLSVVWTIVVFPGVWLVMMLGLAKILVSFLIPPLAPLVAWPLAVSTDGLIWAVKGLGTMDISMMRIGQIGMAPILLYYTLLLTVMAAPFRRPIIRKGVYVSLAVVVVAWVGWAKWQHTHRPDLTLTCLDVGHGQAIVAHLPGSKALLLDAGSMYKSDIGSRVVNPYLDYSGLSGLDAALVSHTDVDHLNGLPEVLYHCRVKAIYADLGKKQSGLSQTGDLLRDFLDQQGLILRPLSDLQTDWGRGVEILLLWPPAHSQTAQRTILANDLSAVLLIRFAGKQILLCSDIEQSAQGQLLQRYPNLKADVLVVPHHGSTKTLAPDFIERLNPKVLICSCSQSQYQDCQVVQPNQDQTTFYTGRDGAVSIHVDRAGRLQVKEFLTGRSNKFMPAPRPGTPDIGLGLSPANARMGVPAGPHGARPSSH
jgi:competence protein ComEC